MDAKEIFVLTVVVAMLIAGAIGSTILSDRENECQSKNGVLLKTADGYKCVEIKGLK